MIVIEEKTGQRPGGRGVNILVTTTRAFYRPEIVQAGVKHDILFVM